MNSPSPNSAASPKPSPTTGLPLNPPNRPTSSSASSKPASASPPSPVSAATSRTPAAKATSPSPTPSSSDCSPGPGTTDTIHCCAGIYRPRNHGHFPRWLLVSTFWALRHLFLRKLTPVPARLYPPAENHINPLFALVAKPQAPSDNYAGEHTLRPPVIGCYTFCSQS